MYVTLHASLVVSLLLYSLIKLAITCGSLWFVVIYYYYYYYYFFFFFYCFFLFLFIYLFIFLIIINFLGGVLFLFFCFFEIMFYPQNYLPTYP